MKAEKKVQAIECRPQSVWPEKIAKCLSKSPENDFTRKMIDFDNFTKNG